MPVKVLMLSNLYPSRQKPYAGIFVKNQYEYLKNKLGLDIELYYMRRSLTGPIGSIFKYIVFFIRFLPRLFRKYDIIHIQYFGLHFFISVLYRLLHRRTTVIVTVHGADADIFRYRRLSLGLIRSYDRLIAVSGFHRQYLAATYSVKCDKILCAGIDREIFKPDISAEFKYDFLYTGSFYPVKGLDILVEALTLSKERYRLCFIGSGELEYMIRELSNHLSHEIELKRDLSQAEIAGIMNASRFLVFPSRADSFGLVVSEALYCGTPVIVSGQCGAAEQVKHGQNGFILTELSAEQLQKQLHSCYKLDAIEYAKLKEKTAGSNNAYSLENVCRCLMEMYTELYRDRTRASSSRA